MKRATVRIVAAAGLAAVVVAWAAARRPSVSGEMKRRDVKAAAKDSGTAPCRPIREEVDAGSAVRHPVSRTRAGVVTREMLRKIVELLSKPGSMRERKACFDAIRRQGSSAIPVLRQALRESATAGETVAAIDALAGLRHMARAIPHLLEKGESVADLSRRFGVPEETIRGMMDAGEWPAEVSDEMAAGAWNVVYGPADDDLRRGAIGSLYSLSDESVSVRDSLLAYAGDPGSEPQLRELALTLAAGRLAPEEAGPLARMAVAEDDPLFRFRAGLEYLNLTKDGEALRGTLLDEARSAALDASVPDRLRGLAVEVFGRIEGAASHPALVRLLDPIQPDDVRCAAIRTLAETEGLDLSLDAIRSVASEPNTTMAKALAARLLSRLHH